MVGEIRDPSGLVWYPELGMGWHQGEANGLYDAAYFQKYQGYRTTPIANALMTARALLTNKYCGSEPVIDIGIGSGHFIEVRGGATYGYDVNPVAIRWLLDRNLWADPFAKSPTNVTCWDSLEHMKHPDLFLDRVQKRLLVSIPVFTDMEHVLKSKHFRPNEHFWYWTTDGFLRWVKSFGFNCLEQNSIETELGREGIGTFVFSR